MSKRSPSSLNIRIERVDDDMIRVQTMLDDTTIISQSLFQCPVGRPSSLVLTGGSPIAIDNAAIRFTIQLDVELAKKELLEEVARERLEEP